MSSTSNRNSNRTSNLILLIARVARNRTTSCTINIISTRTRNSTIIITSNRSRHNNIRRTRNSTNHITHTRSITRNNASNRDRAHAIMRSSNRNRSINSTANRPALHDDLATLASATILNECCRFAM